MSRVYKATAANVPHRTSEGIFEELFNRVRSVKAIQSAIDESIRVLKPGGKAIIAMALMSQSWDDAIITYLETLVLSGKLSPLS